MYPGLDEFETLLLEMMAEHTEALGNFDALIGVITFGWITLGINRVHFPRTMAPVIH